MPVTMTDYWQKCNVCGHLKQRATPGGCPKGHVAGFTYADNLAVSRFELEGSLAMVRVQMRRNRMVGTTRVPAPPELLFANIIERHPRQAMALVQPEGWAHAVWVGLDEFVENAP